MTKKIRVTDAHLFAMIMDSLEDSNLTAEAQRLLFEYCGFLEKITYNEIDHQYGENVEIRNMMEAILDKMLDGCPNPADTIGNVDIFTAIVRERAMDNLVGIAQQSDTVVMN
ncbi:hypothetical protein [Photobacterium satsumensis]|uniref:hypothetical protein n=1 Tax=Photobacterium satsumensis TaxID=2910239 RepID=UPI003D0E970A